MEHVDAGHHLEQLAEHVERTAVATRCKAELARIGLGIGDELQNRLGRNRRVHLQDVGHADHAGNRCDVANEIEIELFVQRRVDRVGREDDEEGVSVGRRTHHRLGGDIAGGARSILDDEWLTEPFRQPLTDQARDDVDRAARGKSENHAHRPDRIGLSPCNARDGGKGGRIRCQTQ
jgi:hypothetical protein